MSDRDLTRARFGYDDMDADRLNECAEEVARLRAQVSRLQAAARKAHDAMTNWHFVHGEPGALMSPEEAEMGEACKTIAALLDEEPPLEDVLGTNQRFAVMYVGIVTQGDRIWTAVVNDKEAPKGKRCFEGTAPTIDAAIRNAVQAVQRAKGQG